MRELPHVLGIVLAGGEGKRLYPLTADRAKPAVPFGGAYRLIDFVLSNLVNARYLRICVLTQYKSHSLDRHISQNWRLSGLAGEYITPVPAQQRLGPRWYTGSADAIYQSLNLIYDEDPDYIVVFGADHVYRMDPEQMVHFHIESGAGATVAGIRVPRAEATAFGCIDAEESGRIRVSSKSLPTRRAHPTTPSRRSCRWATTSSRRRCSSTRSAPTPTTTTPITTWAAISSRGWSATAWPPSTTSTTTKCQAPPNAITAIGATSARSTRSTTLTWTWCRYTRCSTSTTSDGRSGARPRCWRRPSSSTAARRRSPWSGRAASFRLRRYAIRCCRPMSWSMTARSWRAA